jgi:hypothetical protein
MGYAIYAAILGTILGAVVVCGLKGKYGMIAGGIFLHPLWFVGAIRLAKPDSVWARKNYSEDKMAAARTRDEDRPNRYWGSKPLTGDSDHFWNKSLTGHPGRR